MRLLACSLSLIGNPLLDGQIYPRKDFGNLLPGGSISKNRVSWVWSVVELIPDGISDLCGIMFDVYDVAPMLASALARADIYHWRAQVGTFS